MTIDISKLCHDYLFYLHNMCLYYFYGTFNVKTYKGQRLYKRQINDKFCWICYLCWIDKTEPTSIVWCQLQTNMILVIKEGVKIQKRIINKPFSFLLRIVYFSLLFGSMALISFFLLEVLLMIKTKKNRDGVKNL